VFREKGFRYWLAWCLVRVAHRVKDTTFYQVIRLEDGRALMVDANAWGDGLSQGRGIFCLEPDDPDALPAFREFDDIEAAVNWFWGEDAA
jgi:hypothetical protein